MIKALVLCLTLFVTGFIQVWGQTDSTTIEREATKKEMIEMREKLEAFLSEQSSSADVSRMKQLQAVYQHQMDSLHALLKFQQAEIKTMNERIKQLELKAQSKPEILDKKFDSILVVLYFDNGSYQLSPENLQKISKIGSEKLHDVLQLVAYTDWVGNNEFNQKLSDQRAATVQSELLKAGYDIAHLKMYSKGKMAEENNKLSAQECRRVEIRY